MENTENVNPPKKIRLDADDLKSHVDKLPDLALLEIFDKLNAKERRNSRLTSRRWANLTNEVSKETLMLDCCLISSKCPPWTTIIESGLKFYRVIIGNGLLVDGDATPFWKTIGEHVKVITLNWNNFPSTLAKDFLKNFPMLEKIEVPDLNALFSVDLPERIVNVHVTEIPRWISNGIKEKLDKLKLQILTADRVKWTHDDDNVLVIFDAECEVPDRDRFGPITITPSLNILNEKIFPKNILRNMQGFEMTKIASKYINAQHTSVVINKQQNCTSEHTKVELKSVIEVQTSSLNSPCNACITTLKECVPNLEKLVAVGGFPQLPPILDAFKHVTDLKLFKLISTQENDDSVPLDFPNLENLHLEGTDLLTMKFDNWKPMPKLRKLYLFIDDMTKGMLNDLIISKTPNLVELDLYGAILMENPKDFFQMIENGWPKLKILKLAIAFKGIEVKEADFLNSIQGKYKELRYIEHSFKEDETIDNKKLRMEVFDKIPSLRRLTWMTYAMYCAEKYQVTFDEVAMRNAAQVAERESVDDDDFEPDPEDGLFI